jgi:IMP dehydrogenase
VKKDLTTYAAEGVEMLVPCKGRISDLMNNLISSIKSGFSYCGAKNIEEVWKNAEFIQISQSALLESHPHTVFKT